MWITVAVPQTFHLFDTPAELYLGMLYLSILFQPHIPTSHLFYSDVYFLFVCRFYTIRYRERNRKWIYQTCPTSDTVIDNLKPNTPYEFGVRSNKDDRSGMWSKPVIHNTNMGSKDQIFIFNDF